MRHLTSFSVSLSKRWVPALFFAFLGVVVVHGVLEGELLSAPGSLLGLVLVAAIAYGFQKFLVSDTLDEVVDAGSHLLVRRGATKDRIDLRDILKIDATRVLNPPLITLRLATPCKFGRLVTFIPAGGRLNPFGEHPLARELADRAQALRETTDPAGH